MLCGHSACELSIRPDPPGLRALYVQQVLPTRGSFVGGFKSEGLLVGSGVLPAVTTEGEESCRGAEMLGAALAKDPLENLANKDPLQLRVPQPKSTQTWVMGPFASAAPIPLNNFYEKTLLSTENLWAVICHPFRVSETE